MKFQVLNGSFFDADQDLIHASNRVLCFGDGFFESIRVFNGKAPFITLHWERLLKACEILQIDIPEQLNLKTFRTQVLSLAERNGEPNSRVRFQGFRAGSGRYAPTESILGWSMTSIPLETSTYQLNKVGLKMGFCTTHSINPKPQSTFKSSNSIPYILGAIDAKKRGWDDCFLSDVEGFIAESTASNVFVIRGNELLTPDLSGGGVSGVMRNVVLNTASEIGLRPQTVLMKKDDIMEADECFLTNATRGIRWVGAIEKKRYFKRNSERLINHINQKFRLLS